MASDLNNHTKPFMRQLSFESGPPAQTDSYQTHVDGRTHFSGSPTASEELVLKTGIVTLPSEANEDEQRRKRHRRIGAAALLIFCLVTGAIILGVVLGARNNTLSHATDGLPAGDSPRKAAKGEKLWGVGGDTMTTDSGNKFVYNNTLGGTWVSIPFNDTARPQGDQPSLSERWDYSVNRILGVNLGGWLVTEPFITPSLYEPYAKDPKPVSDEWHLCQKLGDKMASTIENHYATFFTEEDFAEIASAGLNWVRIPVGWWMIETWSGEPFLEGVSFKYFLKAITWARKYGLRVNLDLHAIPGSQNGWNHSGRTGGVNFLNGVMGIANSQRALNYIAILAQFASQPQYKNVIPMFGVLNEPFLMEIGPIPLRSWYYQVYQLLRSVGGTGEGNGPFMAIHDGFGGPAGGGPRGWDGFLAGADRLALDSHTYLCFGPQNADTVTVNSMKPCTLWAPLTNETMASFGLHMTAEYSLAVNDCGLFVNNVGLGTRFEGTFPYPATPDTSFKRVGSCDAWLDHRQWSEATKSGFADFAQNQQDAMRNSFFWTWKIGKSLNQDFPPNPMWNYQNGLQNGYIRPDARQSNGYCATVLVANGIAPVSSPWSGTLAPWQTGGEGAGKIVPAQIQAYGTFPPVQIQGGANGNLSTATLPKYVQTGEPLSLKEPSSPSNIGVSSTQLISTTRSWVPQKGCTYPEPWEGVGIAPPAQLCSATS